jgi:hypothetical protein
VEENQVRLLADVVEVRPSSAAGLPSESGSLTAARGVFGRPKRAANPEEQNLVPKQEDKNSGGCGPAKGCCVLS